MPPSESEAETETAAQPTEVEVQASRVTGALRQLIPDVSAEPARNYVRVTVPVEQLEPAARVLRDSLGYALLSMVTAVDYPDHIEVIYLAFALDHPHGVELRTQLPREELPDCPSLTSVWPGADLKISLALLALLGFAGGFFIVPIAALLQHRPARENKGQVQATAQHQRNGHQDRQDSRLVAAAQQRREQRADGQRAEQRPVGEELRVVQSQG